MAAKAAGIKSVDGRMTACDDECGWRKKQRNNQPTKGSAKRAVVGGDNGDATATVMDSDGRCNGNATAMMVMEPGGDGGGTPTSDGRHRGMLAHYVRESVHLELSSFGYKYCAPPTARRTASPTLAPSRPWTCVVSTAHRGMCQSSMPNVRQ